jgi:hypothetical protein
MELTAWLCMTMTQAADKAAIGQFNVNFPEVELADLRRRINATGWLW